MISIDANNLSAFFLSLLDQLEEHLAGSVSRARNS